MGKYDRYIIQKILAPLSSFTVESIHRIYFAALKMFKIYDSIVVVDSNDNEDEIDFLSESSGVEADW